MFSYSGAHVCIILEQTTGKLKYFEDTWSSWGVKNINKAQKAYARPFIRIAAIIFKWKVISFFHLTDWRAIWQQYGKYNSLG